MLNHAEIQAILPHRHPMLLVDVVRSIKPGISIRAAKCVTGNEACFASLAGRANGSGLVYPFSLILESWGQAGVILWIQSAKAAGYSLDGVLMLAAARDCYFEAEVLPGDTMEHQVELERLLSDTVFLSGETWAGGRRIARMEWVVGVVRPVEALGR